MHIYDIMAAPKHLRRGDYPYGGLRSRSGGLRSPIWGSEIPIWGSEIPDPGVPTRVRGPDLGSGVPIWGPGSRSGIWGPDPDLGSRPRGGVRSWIRVRVAIFTNANTLDMCIHGISHPHVGDYP
jgi:hypothetical protein